MLLTTYLLPILSLAALCAAWAGVQLLARRMGTKNHIDHNGTDCGNCGCGISCEREIR